LDGAENEDVDMIDGERPGSELQQAAVLGLGALTSKGRMADLLLRAFRASPMRWALVEVVDGDLVVCDGHPRWAETLGLVPLALDAPLRVSELGPPLALFDLWLDSCQESWRVLENVSCQFLDRRTSPPRRLEISVAPMLEETARALCLCFFEDVVAPRAARAAEPPADGPPADGPLHDSSFHEIADTVPVLLWTAGPSGERDYFNRAFLDLTQRTLGSLVGDGWLDLVHPEDLAAVHEVALDAYHGHDSFHIEYRLRRHDGVWRWVLDRGTPRFRSDGRFLGFAGSSVDITERRRIEERLRISERYYRELIDGTDNLVTQIDAEGRLSFLNPVSREIYGAEPEECIGFPFLDFVHPDDRELTRRHFERWQRGGISCVTFENRQVSRNGDVRDMLWTVNPHYDEPGMLVAINAIGQDITERKRSERVHKIQSQVLESMTEGVTLTNPAGFILYTNRAQDAMFGYEPGELIGQHFGVLEGQPAEVAEAALQSALVSDGFYFGEFRHRKKDGTLFFTSARISTLEIDGAGYSVAVVEDISAQKKDAEERHQLDLRIRQAQKLESLGVLAGGIAHDFNNLLMVMLGNASLALQDLDAGTPLHHDIEQIETAALRASELTKQMLAYSGKGHFVVEPADLSQLIETMEPLLRASLPKHSQLELRLARELPRVEADVSQLRQVVISLVSNAAEALVKEGGSISVRTGSLHCDRSLLDSIVVADELPEGEYVVLEVQDSGIGIDASVLARIFDPFFTTKFTGRGLGLAAVLGIVRGHRGGIKIDSAPGRGTIATVLLPSSTLSVRPSAPVVLAPEPDDLEIEGTVLVVDDEETVRAMAERMLTRIGFQVLTATDGAEAIEIFRRRQGEISLVLLDMTMPRMDGEATFHALRALCADVKVILTSGYSEQIAADRFGSGGPAAFLQKPYRPADLVHKIDEVLEPLD
jgi:two-component system cell cycle sensor histidine kinase/response regulator CckA